MLEHRRTAILHAIVREYIRTSQPVSSSIVASDEEISASSATIRAEMAALEQEGYLHQPHSSAGRVPTDLAYRSFVNHLPAKQTNAVHESTTLQASEVFSRATGEIEEMMLQAGRLLTTLTGNASVVVASSENDSAVRLIQLVRLGTQTLLSVVVHADATVEKTTIRIDADVLDEEIQIANAVLNSIASDKTLSQINVDQIAQHVSSVSASNVANVTNTATSVLIALQQSATSVGEKVVVSGASQLANAFDAIDVMRNVLVMLEQQYAVVSLIRDLLQRNVNVAIGSEHESVPLAQCSLVIAPTFVRGVPRGSVAILGPTRMDYAHAMAAVAVVSEGLSDKLSGQSR